MAEMLGRNLLPGENIYHINGYKADNGSRNLALWVTMQSAKQRPQDMAMFAKVILERY